MTEQDWQVLEREAIMKHPNVSMTLEQVRLPDGQIIRDWPMVRTRDYVNVLVFNPAGQALILEGYKHGMGSRTWQVPSTLLEDGDDPLLAAQDALYRTVACDSNDWRYLGSFVVDPHQYVGMGHFFLACDAAPIAGAHPQQQRDGLTVHWVPPGVLRQALWDGRIGAASYAITIALGMLALHDRAIPRALAHITAHERRSLTGYEYS